MKVKSKRKIFYSVLLIVLVLVLSISGALVALFKIDVGHDIFASSDPFMVEVKMTVAQDSGYEIVESNGIVTLKKTGGTSFTSKSDIPLHCDIYFKGETYTAVRLMLMEQWNGIYAESINSEPNVQGILPEYRFDLSFNEDLPVADCRHTDGYVYLCQYQTTLLESEVDTNWQDDTILTCKAEDEVMYKSVDGSFVEDAEGEWRKITLFENVKVPVLTDESDHVNNPTVTDVKLHVKVEGVQFNRLEKFWNIKEIPAQTNVKSEEGSEG